MKRSTPARRAGESGNVLFYILIAVALIAALSYAVAQSSRGSSGQLSEERARLMATEIMEYASILTNAAGQLRLRGCAPEALSFEGGPAGSYANANAPSDNSCHIFHVGGGGIGYRDVPDSAAGGSWVVSAEMDVDGIGTSGTADANMDLTAYVRDVNDAVCVALNRLAGVEDPDAIPAQAQASFANFDGDFDDAAVNRQIGAASSGTDKLSGRSAGCFTATGLSENVFYKVLIAR